LSKPCSASGVVSDLIYYFVRQVLHPEPKPIWRTRRITIVRRRRRMKMGTGTHS
jgi:hypothetical protein